MPNFFTDNDDILDFLQHKDLRDIVMLAEQNYAQAAEFDYAPTDYEDALDNYRRTLEVLGQIAGDFIAPRAEDVDREGAQWDDGVVTYARGTTESLEQLAKAELMGLTLPRKYDGLNMPVLLLSMAIEIVTRADVSIMNLFGLQDIAETINKFGSDEQRRKYLPKMSSGESSAAMALTEPDAGSDLGNVQLRAAFDEESGTWRLDGVKRFITNGCADVSLVLARSEPDVVGARGLSMFITEACPEIHVRRIEDKLGIHGSPTCELEYHNAPAELVGMRKRGLSTYVMSMMNGARLAIASQSVGVAQAALEEALEYAAAREQFGLPIRKFPAVRLLLGRMHMLTETARLLTYETAMAVDMVEHIEAAKEAGTLNDLPGGADLGKQLRKWRTLARALTPIAKFYASEACNSVAYDAIQVLGGSGFMRDYAAERIYRDARITTIYEGTTQIQQAASLSGVLRGVIEARLAELHEQREQAGACAQSLKTLADARALLAETVAFANGQEQDFRDLHAGKIVESATTIYNGYLLLEAASHSAHKAALAEFFFQEELPRVAMYRDQVLTGGRTLLDKMDALLDYT
jgi:alkylation response protein AidB-like acyl-CoA dehydrogenase